MTQQVNKVTKELKIVMPPSKDGFMRICKALNMHCTEMLAFEGLLFCRGKNMEEGPAEEFDFDRMISFLHMKSKMVAPADNPRNHLTTKGDRNTQSYHMSMN